MWHWNLSVFLFHVSRILHQFFISEIDWETKNSKIEKSSLSRSCEHKIAGGRESKCFMTIKQTIRFGWSFSLRFECNNKCFEFLLPEWLCFPFVFGAREWTRLRRLMIRCYDVELKPQVDRIIQVASLIRDTSLMWSNWKSLFAQIA